MLAEKDYTGEVIACQGRNGCGLGSGEGLGVGESGGKAAAELPHSTWREERRADIRPSDC